MSFSAEMKDFLGAWGSVSKINSTTSDQAYKEAQTDALTKKTAKENDPETLALEDEKSRLQLQHLKAQISNTGNAGAYTQAQIAHLKSLDAALKAGGGAYPTGNLPTTMQGQPGGTPVLGVAPGLANTMQDDPDAYANGGAVPTGPRYAGGGVVPVAPAVDDSDDDEPSPAAPVAAQPAIGGGMTDVSSRGRGGSQLAPALLDSAHEAVQGGYAHLTRSLGLGRGGIRTEAQKRAAIALQQGAGGLSPQEMEMARNAVDPDKKLTDSQRNLAALGSVYQFWANKGEPEKAQKVAGQMLQHYRAASERYAAIAAHAAQSGDMDLATKAAVKAYANVPDGKDFQLFKDDDGQLNYSYTDADGKTIAKGVATPQQLASSAMGLASGGFDKALLSAAGQKEAAVPTAKPGKVQTASDRAKQLTLPDEEIELQQKKWQAQDGNQNKPLDDAYWGDLKDASMHILQENGSKVTPREAVAAAHKLITPGKDPEKAEFKVTPPTEDDPKYKIKTDGGVKITLDDDQFEALMNQRAARVKAAVDKIDRDTAAGDEPTKTERALGAVKDIGKGIAGAVGDSPVGTVGRALPAVGGAIMDAVRSGPKTGVQPIEDQTVYP